ncbi:disintegrin and metallo ase domain-containing 12-like, partial [Paramuricea clavata]
DETVERSISFLLNGNGVVLDLVPNRNLVSPRYKERHYLSDGVTVLRKRTHDCFFHGHVRNEENSNLALTTCEGFHGYFRRNDETFFIQPLFDQSQKRVAHVVYSPNDITGEKFQCPHDGVQTHESDYDFLNPFPLHEHHRSRRDILTEKKYVELILVNDDSQLQIYGGDIPQTKLRAISIANVVDSIYKAHNIRIALVMVETWTNGDPISVVNDSSTTLVNFRNYKRDVLDVDETTKDHDNAQLLSPGLAVALDRCSSKGHMDFSAIVQTNYGGNIAGLAYVRTICVSNYSVGIESDTNSNAAFTGAVMAHEMGHNFGLLHDDGKIFVSRSPPPELFSQCSIDDLETLLLGNVGHCLFNQPTKFATDAACGNGFVEDGEECDCGTQEDCVRANNTCCNYTSCTLYEKAQCADGVCCSDCQFISGGTVCREAVNSCDVPEYCNGTSEVCPANLVTVNGISCGNNQGYCQMGECRTHDDQCDELWIGAFKADDSCYDFVNTLGDERGYCKKLNETAYMPCEPMNSQCGKLMCAGNSTITPKNLGYRWSSSNLSLIMRNVSIICWSARIFQAEGLPELSTVLDGTKCGEKMVSMGLQKMVCQNNECVLLSVAYAGQPTCANNCSGNGVCNENGNCHCKSGWKCPDCSQAYNGPGGSIDSDLHCETVTSTTTQVPDIDECLGKPCDVNARCNNSEGSFDCQCNVGYSGNGFICSSK